MTSNAQDLSNVDTSVKQSEAVNNPNAEKLDATTFQISVVLANDCGPEFQGANNIVVEYLKKHKINSDIPGINFPDYGAWSFSYKAGNLTSQEMLKNIMDRWASYYGIGATIEELINILEKERLMYAAGNLNNYLVQLFTISYLSFALFHSKILQGY